MMIIFHSLSYCQSVFVTHLSLISSSTCPQLLQGTINVLWVLWPRHRPIHCSGGNTLFSNEYWFGWSKENKTRNKELWWQKIRNLKAKQSEDKFLSLTWVIEGHKEVLRGWIVCRGVLVCQAREGSGESLEFLSHGFCGVQNYHNSRGRVEP